jgi:hypothetical protein
MNYYFLRNGLTELNIFYSDLGVLYATYTSFMKMLVQLFLPFKNIFWGHLKNNIQYSSSVSTVGSI